MSHHCSFIAFLENVSNHCHVKDNIISKHDYFSLNIKSNHFLCCDKTSRCDFSIEELITLVVIQQFFWILLTLRPGINDWQRKLDKLSTAFLLPPLLYHDFNSFSSCFKFFSKLFEWPILIYQLPSGYRMGGNIYDPSIKSDF